MLLFIRRRRFEFFVIEPTKLDNNIEKNPTDDEKYCTCFSLLLCEVCVCVSFVVVRIVVTQRKRERERDVPMLSMYRTCYIETNEKGNNVQYKIVCERERERYDGNVLTSSSVII